MAVHSSVGNLTDLIALGLSDNQLSGAIPAGLGSLTRLTTLYLGSNQLSGSIPPELQTISNLRELGLAGNQLSGAIPAELGTLDYLTHLYLSSNQLSGSIPAELGNLTTLIELHLSHNQLTGAVPASLGSLVNLEKLYMDNNMLSGPIPVPLGGLSELTDLDASYNSLSGPIPGALGNLSDLQWLNLRHNNLGGTLPNNFGSNLTNARFINFSGNRIEGAVPNDLCIAGIVLLSPGYNRFTSAANCVTSLSPDWAQTQTVAPSNLQADPRASGRIELSWEPILFSSNGYYEILGSTTASGPFNLFGTTATKADNHLLIGNLVPDTTYYFVARAVTPPHAENPNMLVSEASNMVSATTVPGSTPTATRTPTRTPTSAPTVTGTRTVTRTPTALSSQTATQAATVTGSLTPTPTATRTPTPVRRPDRNQHGACYSRAHGHANRNQHDNCHRRTNGHANRNQHGNRHRRTNGHADDGTVCHGHGYYFWLQAFPPDDPAVMPEIPSRGKKEVTALPMKIRFFSAFELAMATFYSDLVPHLASMGHEVEVVISRAEYRAGRNLEGAIGSSGNVSILRTPNFRMQPDRPVKTALLMLIYVIYTAVYTLVAPGRACNVFLSTPPLLSLWGYLLSVIRRQPYYCIVMDVYPDLVVEYGGMGHDSALTRLLNWLSVFTLRKAAAVIVIGRCMAEVMVSKGVERENIRIIPNWMNEKLVVPVEHAQNSFRKAHHLGDKFVVLYSGNMGAYHHFKDILDVAEQLKANKEVVFVFVGNGSRRAEIEERVTAQQLTNVMLLPFQDATLLSSSLSAGDLHLVTLHERCTGLAVPSKSYGILAVGRPILYQGEPHGEIARLIVEEDVGSVVPIGDVELLKQRILQYVENPELGRAQGRRARRLVEEAYSRSQALRRYARVLSGTAVPVVQEQAVILD